MKTRTDIAHGKHKAVLWSFGAYSPVLWPALGATLALLAWLPLNVTGQLGVLWLLVMAWLVSPTRFAAASLILAYYLVIGRDVSVMISRFTGIAMPGAWAIIMLYSACIAAFWAVAWHRSPRRRLVGLLCVLLATALPPLGGFIYGSPLLAAGWLYPGLGLWGVLLITMSWITSHYWIHESKHRKASATAFAMMVLVSVFANMEWKAPESKFIHSVNTRLPLYPKQLPEQYQRQLKLTGAAMQALNQPLPVVVLPEEIAGTWQPRFAWLWEEVNQAYLDAGKTLIVGFDTQPDQYANTAKVFGIKALGQPDIYARIPAPIGGWKPWSEVHAPARWGETAMVTVVGQPGGRLALFFCWEELVPWPWLITMLANPDQPPVALLLVNNWFAKDLAIGDAQAKSSQAWARLMGWPHVRVVNEPVDN